RLPAPSHPGRPRAAHRRASTAGYSAGRRRALATRHASATGLARRPRRDGDRRDGRAGGTEARVVIAPKVSNGTLRIACVYGRNHRPDIRLTSMSGLRLIRMAEAFARRGHEVD